jgi:PGAP1-like protein
MNIHTLKVTAILSVFLFLCMPTMAQQRGKDESLRKVLDKMFAHIDKNKVPTGLLRDYAEEYEDLDIFTGIVPLTEHNAVDYVRFAYLLSTIKSADLIGEVSKDIDVFFCQKKSYDENNSISLSLALYKYSQIKENALKDGLITYKNDQVYTTNKDPYKQGYLFACSSLVENTTESSIIISLPQSNLLTNMHLSKLEVNLGNGFQEMGVNKKVKANLQQGRNEIIIKATLDNGQSLLSHMFITKLERKPDGLTRASEYRFLSNPLSDTIVINGDDYRGISTTAKVMIIPSRLGNGKISKPFIFVEGFNPQTSNNAKCGQGSLLSYYRDWSKFITDNGYDFVYVHWCTPEEYIQANAYTLVKIIETINNMSAQNSEPSLLIGHSMGGLVARYALKTMENKNKPHHVGTYVSYDAPHLGANVPIGLLHGFYGIRKFLQEKNLIDKLIKKIPTAKSYLEIGEKLAYSTAAQQMLCNSIDAAGHLNNSLHVQWQEELRQLGFPNGDKGKNFQMLGIANSDYSTSKVPSYYINLKANAGTKLTSDWISPLTGLVIGIGLQDVIAGLLASLPGRTSADFQFECLPGKSQGQRVNYFKLALEKDFLWTIPIKKSIFKYEGFNSSPLLYDIYPSSKFDYKKMDIGDGETIPFLADYWYSWGININIPFIPTSSALAYNGISLSPSSFTFNIDNTRTAFGNNFYLETNDTYKQHMSFSQSAQNWILSHINQTVTGPIFGYSGAKYTLSGAKGTVVWSTSDASIGTINQNGILTVSKNGCVYVIGETNGMKFSKLVYIGVPTYLLSSKHKPDGFEIEAKCIDETYKANIDNINSSLIFRWGVKFPNKDIRWIDTNSPSVFIPIEDKDAVVFLKIIDSNGKESLPQSVKCTATDIFYASNNRLLLDAAKKIYKEDGTTYSYKYGKIYLTRDISLSKEYEGDIWTSTKAKVYSPFNSTYIIPVSRGEMSIKDVLPQEELDYITHNMQVDHTCLYTIALLNPEDKFIQIIPVTIKIK